LKFNLSSGFITGLLLGTFIAVISRFVSVEKIIKEEKLKDLSLFGRSKKSLL